MIRPLVVLPEYYGQRLAASSTGFGQLSMKWSRRHAVHVVDGYQEGVSGSSRKGISDVPNRHFLVDAKSEDGRGLWFRVDADAHLVRFLANRISATMTLEAFRAHVIGGKWITLPRPGSMVAVTVTTLPEVDKPDFAAWLLTEETGRAEYLDLDLMPEVPDLLAPLAGHWPLHELAGMTVLLIGAGSIGSAAAESLASYGVRRVLIVDPDRLRAHNFARHRTDPRNLGRFKAEALRAQMKARDPALEVEALLYDVIYDADEVRGRLAEVDVALVTTDGVESRRAANHLLARAGIPTVFACALADGAFGEVLRTDPPRTGCLLCAREAMVERGEISPESSLDRGYGTGTRHLPMTAAPGDLWLVGELAAKTAVATLLAGAGFREQRLAGDHAVFGLQPRPNTAAPFDSEYATDLRWHALPSPRPDCPSCGR